MTTLLSMSLGGSILILITLLMRPIIRKWCSGRTALVVWSFSVIRLVCPLFLPVYMSFYNHFTVTGNPYTPKEIINDFSVASAELPLSRLVIEPYFSGKINWTALELIWLAGAVICYGVHLARYYRNCKQLSESLPADRPYIRQWQDAHPLRHPYQIRVYDRIPTPVAYGLIRTVILLDKESAEADEKQLDLILTHEYLHIRRFHLLIKWVIFLTCVIHWFNPLVWLMGYIVQSDIEADCDEAVIRNKGENVRMDYLHMLVENRSTRQRVFLFTAHFCSHLEKRTRRLLEQAGRHMAKQKSLAIGAAAVICLLTVGIQQPQIAAAYQAPSFAKNLLSENQTSKTVQPGEYLFTDQSWTFDEGENITITLRHTDIGFPVGQAIEVGYLLDDQQVCLYKGQNKTGVQISFTAPQSGNYTFYLCCKSSDSIILQDFEVR